MQRLATTQAAKATQPAQAVSAMAAPTQQRPVPVTVVAGAFIRVPQDPMIERVAAGSGMDAADDWIVERAGATGAVIGLDKDRTVAQSLLDYWVTALYRSGEDMGDVALATFDPTAVGLSALGATP